MDPQILVWLSCYRWLYKFSKTPADMGLTPDRIDPRYYQAMELIDDVRTQIEKEK